MQTEQLIEQARKGNDLAFSRLVDDWYPRIYNYALKYFSDHDLAMEAAQRTFIAVHKKLDQLQEASRFKGWLYRIATNYCHEEDRKHKHRFVLPFFQKNEEGELQHDVATEHRQDNPEAEYGKQELANVLKLVLAELPEEQRTVVIMKEYEGLKFREIAEALKISENTAKSRLYYGLKALRKGLEARQLVQENLRYE
ncbi:MAG TPA: RNA polymerase subunit sigma [Cytophagales bacterium]|nr:RNA polymerase subunit sigma [Cytophagales bacterium]HAP64174.1 RNA polymerase subunit sigma [Cytophagales bacterium]